LAFVIHTTTPQQQEMRISVDRTEQPSAGHAVFAVSSEFIHMRLLGSIRTPVAGISNKEIQVRIKTAKVVGGGAILVLVLFILLSLFNVMNFAIWLPAVPALIGLIAMLGAQIERLERQS
jgi:hypothetical protein